MKKKLFLPIILTCVCFVSKAQLPNLSEDDISNFKTTVKEKVESLQNYIAIIGDKQEESDRQDLAIDAAMSLFIDKAKMEVSSVRNGEQIKRQYPMRNYLQRLRALKYLKVKITAHDVAYIGNIRKGVDGKYYGTATIYQLFEGCNADNDCYSDITKKEIDIIIDYLKDEFGEERWIVMLGDVNVAETKKS